MTAPIDNRRIHCVVGGQFGSEAKGHVTAQLLHALRADHSSPINVRVGGSNAGHSAQAYTTHHVVALRTIPVGALVDPAINLIIAAGSEIDPEVLYHEVEMLEHEHNIAVMHRLIIDRYATIIEPKHIAQESTSDLNARTGSTNKGIGAARADRLMRRATIARDYQFNMPFTICDTAPLLRHTTQPIVIEGTQGYGLGLHTEQYPQTTSGDCRAIDLCAQAGVFPTVERPIHVWLTVRTYPIRVAGNSGMLRNELTWEELNHRNRNINTEYTTVTKKVRRVGEWDAQLVREAINANGGTGQHLSICLMFADYLDETIYQVTEYDLLDAPAIVKINELEADMGQRVSMIGTSPTTVIWQ
jgi:adenylosuccinate synthase